MMVVCILFFWGFLSFFFKMLLWAAYVFYGSVPFDLFGCLYFCSGFWSAGRPGWFCVFFFFRCRY